VRSHGLPLTGLTGGVTYYYRVTSADAAANATTEPPPPGTLSFSTPAPACLTDQTDGDFAAGTTTDTYVSSTSDGEVILAPTAAAEFSGSALPAGWTGILWSDGSPGGSTVSGGSAIVDGGRLTSPDPPRYGPGRVLEFVATFAAAAFQHVGFGDGDNSTGSGGMFGSTGVTWAMFSTGTSAGPNLFARLNPGGDVNLGTGFLGSPHRYRIEWRADSVVFMVDGASLDRRAAALATPMRFGASDFDAGGATLSVDWARITPYAASGTFRSRVYDAGVPSTWDAMTWTASVPSAATLALSVRKGNTPAPDGTWTPFAPVAASGSIVGGTSRYIQYQADLGTGDPSTTPVLEDVQIACGPCAGSTPAALTDLSAIATGNAGGGRAFVRLSWSGVPAGEIVKVYRRAYGDYPLYRSGPGAEPAVPATPQAAEAAGWDSTTVHAPNGLDAPPSRGFWYYVAFVSNDCALTSAPSNRTGGTLDYLLGDVSDGIAVCVAGGETGDGEVSTSDLSALGASYGQSFGPTDDRICLDVGPTVDLGLRSRPAPDGFLGFEDLVLYALNFEVPLPVVRIGPPALAQVKSDRDELSLTAPSAVSAGATFEATLHLIGSGAIHALSTRLAWDPAVAELVGFSPAGLVAASGGVVLSPHLGQLDLAVLGRELPGFSGEGDLVKVAFRALRDGDPGVRLAQASARDADNHPLTLGGVTATTPVSYPTRMGLVFPNPFRGSLQVSFSLAREARAKVLVFDLAGRIVRHLEDGVRPAGLHAVAWDGRSDAGSDLSPGFYVIRFESGLVHQTRRVQLIQ
jgi:hypothetical protein